MERDEKDGENRRRYPEDFMTAEEYNPYDFPPKKRKKKKDPKLEKVMEKLKRRYEEKFG